MLDPSKVGWIAAILGGLAIAVTGCQTEAYCFVDCSGETTATTTGTGGAAGDECVFDCGGTGGTGAGGTGTTSVTGTGGDCAGDYTDPHTCGTCANDCFQVALNCKPDKIGCTPSADPGMVPGTCTCGECATDYYDLEMLWVTHERNGMTLIRKRRDCTPKRGWPAPPGRGGQVGNSCRPVRS